MITIMNGDGKYPGCAHDGCSMLAVDGYCEAACCASQRRAYCSAHSHRPDRVLEILGHWFDQATFSRDEVRRLVMLMWNGAGEVYAASGKLDMERDILRARARAAAEQQQQQQAPHDKE